jgi:hypothetical protein
LEPRISDEVMPTLAVEALLTDDEFEQTERQRTEGNVNAESPCCQPTVPPMQEGAEAAKDAVANQGEVANVLVEVNKNEGMELKVSEGMPAVHIYWK